MPWKENNVMDMRTEFVLKSFSKNVNFSELCDEYGISTKTGYKWKNRFIEEGLGGLVEKSRRPKSNVNETPEDIICELVRLKKAHLPWGPKKIRELYLKNHPDEIAPSLSTVKRILEKAGYVKQRKRRKQRSERISNTVIPGKPNDLWTVDFKGWWMTPDKQKCEPLTVRDEFSKYIFSIKILEKSDMKTVKREFQRLFKLYGLPSYMKSDNGVPFAHSKSILGLTKLSVWWLSLGITLDRIRPGCPYENGSHERMHLDIKKELQGHIEGDIESHQNAFDIWRNEYNDVRPHEALAMKTPGEVYKKSTREYTEDIDEILYPMGFLTRKVNHSGYIVLQGRTIFVSSVFTGYNIGIKPTSDDIYEVWFDNFRLGELNLKTEKFYSYMNKIFQSLN